MANLITVEEVHPLNTRCVSYWQEEAHACLGKRQYFDSLGNLVDTQCALLKNWNDWQQNALKMLEVRRAEQSHLVELHLKSETETSNAVHAGCFDQQL
jgi:hypothetical protein